MRAVSPLVIGLILAVATPGVLHASPESGIRDWTIEKPFLAGFMSGLSLTTCRSCSLGSSPVQSSEFDPFGLSAHAYDVLTVHARGPHRFGQSLGFILTILFGIGFLKAHLNRLKGR